MDRVGGQILRFAAVFSWAWAIDGCTLGPPPHVAETVEACEAAGVVLDYYDCQGAPKSTPNYLPNCRRLAALGYVWPDDTSGPVCVRHAESKEEVEACHVVCP